MPCEPSATWHGDSGGAASATGALADSVQRVERRVERRANSNEDEKSAALNTDVSRGSNATLPGKNASATNCASRIKVSED